ncbi:MAG: PAS domain S-box protein [Chloroflexi bacterium]|nr:PAS domain S-box protein [Chloroflexota bacterium]
MGTAYLVFILGLISTAMVYYSVSQYVLARDQARFDQTVQETLEVLGRQMERYVDVLRSVRGLFAASENVSREKWKGYLQVIHLKRNYPGLMSVGYAERVLPEQRAAYVRKMQAEGFPEFEWRLTHRAGEYFPVRFFETRSTEQPRWEGHDFFAEATHRAAMEKARASGWHAASGKITLLSNRGTNGEAGLMIFSPLYRGGIRPESVEERVAKLEGFVFATMQVRDLLQNVFGAGVSNVVDLEIFDGMPLTAENLMYDQDGILQTGQTGHDPYLARSVSVQGLQRKYTLQFHTLPAFQMASLTRLRLVAVQAGLLVSVLLFGIAWVQTRGRLAAEGLTANLRVSELSLRQVNEQLERQIQESCAAERSLRQSEERYRAFVRHSSEGVWRIELEQPVPVDLAPEEQMERGYRFGYVAECNDVMARMYGYSKAEEFAGTRLGDFLIRSEAKNEETLRAFIASGYRLLQVESHELDRQGQTKCFSNNVVGIVENGRLVRVWGTQLDITERKRAEAQQRDSEALYHSLVANLPQNIFRKDLQGRFTFVNQRFCDFLGVPADQIIGRTALDLFPKELAAKYAYDDRRVLQSEDILETVEEYQSPDGKTGYAHLVKAPVYDAQGRLVGLQGIFWDVTEQRRAQEVLAAEKERLAVTVRSIGDGVITTDTEGKIALMNNVAEELTGWPQGEALGTCLTAVFQILVPKTRERCGNPVEQVLRTGQTTGAASQAILISRHGTERLIENRGAPIRDSFGSLTGVVLVFRDITEKQKVEAELLKASKLESVGLLAGGIAHDFNNILTAIIGNLSLSRRYAHPPEPIYQLVEEVEKAALRARDLTQQLVTFAKGGAPVRQTASIGEIIRESAEFVLRGANVRCEFNLPADLAPVEVDAGQISQVIHNLVINGMQAMPEGGVIRVCGRNVRLDAASEVPLPEGRYVRLDIEDHGLGIKAEHLSRIFDPYFTTKKQGSGLGLATAYAILKRHDGLLTVESTVGRGSVFHVYLPASDKTIPSPLERRSQEFRGQGRILIMDDEESILELASVTLRHFGYEVLAAKNGEEAVTLYAQALEARRPFSAVIMDLTIPGGMGGKEAIKKLLTLDRKVKAIVSSGYSSDPVMANYRAYGFCGVVSKPYQIEELGRVVQEVLTNGDGG